MSSLKAWVQDPEDWKITYTPKPPTKSLLDRLMPWIVSAGFILFIMLCNWLVEAIC